MTSNDGDCNPDMAHLGGVPRQPTGRKVGGIIEREKIEVFIRDEKWFAYSSLSKPEDFYGETPLIAAMRCYVASKLGDEVEIPEEFV
jgi:hypothetical protein